MTSTERRRQDRRVADWQQTRRDVANGIALALRMEQERRMHVRRQGDTTSRVDRVDLIGAAL